MECYIVQVDVQHDVNPIDAVFSTLERALEYLRREGYTFIREQEPGQWQALTEPFRDPPEPAKYGFQMGYTITRFAIDVE